MKTAFAGFGVWICISQVKKWVKGEATYKRRQEGSHAGASCRFAQGEFQMEFRYCFSGYNLL